MQSSDNSKVARRYAQALFEMLKPPAFDGAARMLSEAAAALRDHPALLSVLADPSVDDKKREAIFAGLFEKMDAGIPEVAQCGRVLFRSGRVLALPYVAESFAKLVAAFRKQSAISVTTATQISASEQSSLLEELRRQCGGDVTVTWEVDPDVIGGAVVTSGDKMLDGSVRGSLDRLRAELLAG